MKCQFSRRKFLRNSALLTGSAASLPLLFSADAEVLSLDASASPPAAQPAGFHMGTATAPGGHTITVNSRGLVRDGQPWTPISGEFHFSRCPEPEWRDELLKMKAGAICIVTTYVFWIHHEEVEGTWDWSGQRNLREFLETCAEVGLSVLVRIGPWCHGEARNGGFPDWLQKKGDDQDFELRRDNPGYLGYVEQLYQQIGRQMKGLLWKDGGAVIGIQLENEYNENGGPVQHLMTLKQMVRDAGMDVPLYTCTGWGAGGAAPFGEMLPLSGAYAEGFWDRSLAPMPGGYAASFRFSAAGTGVYPFFTCELGAGMMPSYHRRILTYPADAESLALVKLGSGANLLGFYMYHGGENPEGKLTRLNETQATGYWNDLPLKNYDFQAPIGEFGREREHYHWLRLLGLFLHDFGAGLCGMPARMPGVRGALNWAVRSDGAAGYIFVSHYRRLSPQRKLENVQFEIRFAGGDVKVPSEPVAIPDNSRFFWPVHLDLGGVKLIYASAQPVCRVDDRNTRYTVFKQTAGIPAEFVLDGATATLDASTGKASHENSRIHVRNVQPGLGAALRLHAKDGRTHVIILLDEAASLNLWRGPWQGQERLFLTKATLLPDGSALRLRAESPEDCSIAILPAPAMLMDGRGKLAGKGDGLFRRFSPRMAPAESLHAVVKPVQAAGPARTIPMAPSVASRRQGMAMQPEDADFAQAAIWRVKLPAGVAASRDLLLRVRYTGDVIRAYRGEQLLTDDFYHARPFEIALRRYGAAVYRDGIVLKILPLREDAPIYLTDRSQLRFSDSHTALSLDGVDVAETREVRLAIAGAGH
jgi:hypothetical protein